MAGGESKELEAIVKTTFKVNKYGASVTALLLSAGGVALAILVYISNLESGFALIMALSTFSTVATSPTARQQ